VEQAFRQEGTVHFAGHAIPWRGGIGLVVAPDPGDPEPDGRAGIWTMNRPRTIRSDLVVFSACATGAYDDPGSVKPGQLTEAALLAGARQAVGSLWSVDSEATAAWMKWFYSSMASGQSASTAVKTAARAMRSDGRWNHPRYWAAFALYGRDVR